MADVGGGGSRFLGGKVVRAPNTLERSASTPSSGPIRSSPKSDLVRDRVRGGVLNFHVRRSDSGRCLPEVLEGVASASGTRELALRPDNTPSRVPDPRSRPCQAGRIDRHTCSSESAGSRRDRRRGRRREEHAPGRTTGHIASDARQSDQVEGPTADRRHRTVGRERHPGRIALDQGNGDRPTASRPDDPSRPRKIDNPSGIRPRGR